MKNIRNYFKKMRYIPFQNLLLEEDTFNYTLDNFNEDYNTLNEWMYFKNEFLKKIGNHIAFDIKLENYYNLLNYRVYNNLQIEKNEKVKSEDIIYLKNKKDELMEGNYYLSIDLSKAYDLIIDVFGNLNKPIQQIREEITKIELLSKNKGVRLEEYKNNKMDRYKDYVYIFLDNILKSETEIIKKIKEEKCPLVYVRLDEMIFDITGKEEKFEKFLSVDKILDYNIHIKIFKQHCLYYKDYYNIPHRFDIRENKNGKNEYLMINCLYPNQIYKKYNNLEFNELDLRVPTPDIALEYEQKEKPIEFISREEYKEYYNKKVI